MNNYPVVLVSSRAKKIKRWLESFLPDDLVMDIVSRLRLKNVIQCRCVCKRWNDLLSTPEFIALHKDRGGGTGMEGNLLQMIVVDEPKVKSRIDLYYLDKWHSRKKPIVRRIHSYPSFRIDFAQEGFLVMSSFCDHIILIVNPIESDGVKILCPRGYQTNAYGIFFNPTLTEYCVLFGVTRCRREDVKPSISYRLLTLGANPFWRDLSNPFNHKLMYHRPTMEWARPVLVGDYLYWLVAPGTSIMEFNTRTEEFLLIRVPPTQSNNDIITRDIGLLNIDGFLSSVQIFITLSGRFHISVWTLKNHVAQSWSNSSYVVSVDKDTVDPLNIRSIEVAKPITVEYGHLIFQFQTTIFACNLKEKTIRICGKKKHNQNSRFFSHSISLTSLKKCKPVICMEGVDEKEYNENCMDCRRLLKDETSKAGVNKHSDAVEDEWMQQLIGWAQGF